MKAVSTIASVNSGRTRAAIGRLAMAAALFAASTAAHAQQAADPSSAASTSVPAAPAAAPKKTMQEKMAIATGVLGAAFAAFHSIKAATQAPASQAPAAPPPNAAVQ